MGYESKLYVVEKRTALVENGLSYASVIAMFDMCNYQKLAAIFTEETSCYFYDSDGNTKIASDKYGKPITECDLERVIRFLENEVANGEDYRRLAPLLGALKGFQSEVEKNTFVNLVVLHYWY